MSSDATAAVIARMRRRALGGGPRKGGPHKPRRRLHLLEGERTFCGILRGRHYYVRLAETLDEVTCVDCIWEHIQERGYDPRQLLLRLSDED